MAIRRTVSFSKNSKNIFFHILTRCNLKCRHCYINSEQHGKETLSLSTIEAWLKIFSGEDKAVNVIFLGGEPTLHPDLSDAIKIAWKLGYGSVTVDTNGYLFYDVLDKVTPEEVNYFSFSLDGHSPSINDSIRGKGSFEKCVSGLRRAVKKGFHTSLIYTVSRENISSLSSMPHLLKDLGVERFFIQVIGIRGKSAGNRDKDDDKLQLTHDEWLSIVPTVAEEVAGLGITVTWPKVFLAPEEPFHCAGLVADNHFIFPNGRVYRCPLCEDYPVHGMVIRKNRLLSTPRINECDLFGLSIPEGCVMNKIIQPENLSYSANGSPEYRVACCMLKEEIVP